MDTPKDSAPAPRLPDHELLRLDAAAHPERSYAEHIQAARVIAGRTYTEDLRKIQEREDGKGIEGEKAQPGRGSPQG